MEVPLGGQRPIAPHQEAQEGRKLPVGRLRAPSQQGGIEPFDLRRGGGKLGLLGLRGHGKAQQKNAPAEQPADTDYGSVSSTTWAGQTLSLSRCRARNLATLGAIITWQ